MIKNMTTCGFAVAVMGLLAACAAPTETRLPDGSLAYLIDCDGSGRGLNYCFERAGKTCGAEGYSIIDPDGRKVADSTVTGTDQATLVRKYQADPDSILVTCGT